MTLSEEDLQAAASQLFASAADRTAGLALCHPMARAAARWARKLAEPMRVAVAGEIKRGKSTLVNALVAADAALTISDDAQDHAVATGQLETTYVLTELTHGAPAGISIRYRDGRMVTAPLSALREHTVRRNHPEDQALAEVDRVVVTIDAPMLGRFRLIDTPGFNSVYGTDSATSLELLTARGVEGADAIVYTIGNEGLSQISQDITRQFVSPGAAITPLKAIGVMARANELWMTALNEQRLAGGHGDTDPLQRAWREIRAMPPGAGRELFHTIVPVAALLGEAAALASDDDLALLREFRRVDQTELTMSLVVQSPARSFQTRLDFPLCPQTRKRLVQMFSPWGLFTAIRAASAHLPHAELRQLLDERSGLAGLRDLICHHFGERAGTVRVRDAVADLALLTRRLRLRLPESSAEHAVLCGVGRDLEAFEQSQVTSFWQIDVLGEFYRGELSLDPGEVEDLLRLTGERGGGLPARLGVPVGGSQRDLREAAAAASRRWSAAARDGRNRSAAEKMTRVCDALQYAVRSGAAGETSRRDRVQPAMQGPVQRRARRERE